MLSNIKQLQTKLAVKRWYSATIDGDAGPQTWQAVASFLIGSHAPAGTGAAIAAHLDLSTRLRVIYALANVAHECKFAPIAEDLNYSAERICAVWPNRFNSPAAASICANNPEKLAAYIYSGRMGNTSVGDGFKYRGRYWPQLTGRDAYERAQDATGQPFLDNPDSMLTVDGCAIAARFLWDWKGLGASADRDNCTHVRMIWAGSIIGLSEVAAMVNSLKAIWPA